MYVPCRSTWCIIKTNERLLRILINYDKRKNTYSLEQKKTLFLLITCNFPFALKVYIHLLGQQFTVCFLRLEECLNKKT